MKCAFSAAVAAPSTCAPSLYRRGHGVPLDAGGRIPGIMEGGDCYASSLLLAAIGVRNGLSPISVRAVGTGLFSLPISAPAVTRLG